MYPNHLNIAGTTYKIIYVDHPIKVDRNGRKGYDAEVDYWDREIRIWKSEKHTVEDVWWFILHEVLHVFNYNLKLSILDDEQERNQKVHDEIDTLALSLMDFLFRNKLVFNPDIEIPTDGFVCTYQGFKLNKDEMKTFDTWTEAAKNAWVNKKREDLYGSSN